MGFRKVTPESRNYFKSKLQPENGSVSFVMVFKQANSQMVYLIQGGNPRL